uniref:Uncharacterized protein n=1 Tax=Oryza punctata TaxID=4537 RepID=A0A0E0KST5_ORYPU
MWSTSRESTATGHCDCCNPTICAQTASAGTNNSIPRGNGNASRDALPPPLATDQWGAMLLLWEVMSSLGANRPPCYWSRLPSHVPNIRVIPGNVIMSVTVIVYDQRWCFTQKREVSARGEAAGRKRGRKLPSQPIP